MALDWYVLRVASGREGTLRDALLKKRLLKTYGESLGLADVG